MKITKELAKKILLFFAGSVLLVILLLPAIENFKTKNNYEKQQQEQNKINYEKYFGGDNGK